MTKRYILIALITSVLIANPSIAKKKPLINYPNWQSQFPSTNTSIDYQKNTARWTEAFNDPVLDKLIELSLKESPDLAISAARILEARGLSRGAQARRLPTIQAVASQTNSDLLGGDQIRFTQGGVEGTFEVDLFGANWLRHSAANANKNATKADYEAMRLTLISETSKLYATYRSKQEAIRLTEKNLNSIKNTLEIIQTQEEVGEANALDVERTKSLKNTLAAELPATKREAWTNLQSLAIITGQTPDKILLLVKTTRPIPNATILPLLKKPLETIANRPDVKAAAARLKFAKRSHQASKSEWLPKITLSGFYGETSGDTFERDEAWSTTAAARFNLLDFGLLESKIIESKGRRKQAVAQYKRTLLSAITDIEIAINNYQQLTQELELLTTAKQNAQNALKLSSSLYQEGEIGFIDLLDAERSQISADRLANTAKLRQTQALIDLYKALAIQ